MKVYLACGLTHVPRDVFKSYVASIHALANCIQDKIANSDVAYALIKSDPRLADRPFEERAKLCYLWDRRMVEEADVIVAEASYPSIGLGIEIQIADHVGKPVVICFHREVHHRAAPAKYENPDGRSHNLQIGDGYVSLMALGIPTVFRVIGYADPASCHIGVVGALLDLDLSARQITT